MAGRGSVESRGKETWRLTVSMGFDQNGERIRRRKTVKAKNKTEANKLLAAFITEIEAGEYIDPSKMKFADFVEEWRDKYAKEHLAATTLDTYNGHLRTRILPTFGGLRIDEIKPFHVMNFMESLKKEPLRGSNKEGFLSSSTIHYIHRVLNNIFSRAVEWEVIKHNPVTKVKKPKVTQKEADVYDEEEVIKLLSALREEEQRWRILITLAVLTGMRKGELLGLEWGAVDLEAGTISVKQNLVYAGGKQIVKETKTKHSQRIISLPPEILPELKAFKKEWNKNRLLTADLWEGGEHNFVFSAYHGKPLHQHSVKNWWARFIKRHDLRYIRFHDLRHTSATLLLNKGENVKVISSRLGHANVLTTLNIYSHTLRKADELAANHFSSFFADKNKNNTKI
ncbi:site-specific integrase [Bacillus badius]|uniref:site-specific integrase n=1 Tax=Bacillus badius TaxID=1455 RepID=UPI001CBC0AC2|nr:tyrosine-type recombinase/integrase [Bacillus badius]UAT31461.1 site-specific integrase [Bacillus badius]